MIKTKVNPRLMYTRYAMRNMPIALLDRLRVYAVRAARQEQVRSITLEDAVTRALLRGIDVLEAELRTSKQAS